MIRTPPAPPGHHQDTTRTPPGHIQDTSRTPPGKLPPRPTQCFFFFSWAYRYICTSIIDVHIFPCPFWLQAMHSQMAHARSRSPRNCRWEDQGWECICSSCEAALRTWNRDHFQKHPKGEAERIIIAELYRVGNPHGEGRYGTTQGYHPSVRIVPDFVEGIRKKLRRAQELKDMLMSRKPRCQATCTSTQEEDMD